MPKKLYLDIIFTMQSGKKGFTPTSKNSLGVSLRSKRGFTLIELLVVISIISLLSSVVFAGLNSARAKARNAKRTNDIIQLVNAFNLGLTSSSWPTTPGGNPVCVSQNSCWGGWIGYLPDDSINALLAPFISRPVDPVDSIRGTGGYFYANPFDPAPSPPYAPYDGYNYPSGAYLGWLVELPLNVATSCGRGRIFNYAPPNYVSCRLKLD